MRWIGLMLGASRVCSPLVAAVGFWVFLVGQSVGPAAGGAFGRYDQGAKATGMGGAVVAQAQGPSALFYNPGAVALLSDETPSFSGGLELWSLAGSSYKGRSPGIGEGTRAEQEEQNELLPHAFLTRRLGTTVTLGFGVYSPFRLETDWSAKDAFAGRYSTLSASLQTLDLYAGVSKALGPRLGVGLGLTYRSSELEHRSRLASFDPAAGVVVDVADQSIGTSREHGFGFAAGLLHRPNTGLSWGAAYHSAIEIDYSGSGRLTQIQSGNVALDQLLAATLPFDQSLAVASRVEFPDSLTVGVALHPNPLATFELDVSREGWGSVQRLLLAFVNDPNLSSAIFLGFSDTTSYRLGASFEQPGGNIYRIGVSREESPLPDRALGALFPDGDRTGYHVGISRGRLDAAFVWTDVGSRSTVTSVDGLNGSYDGDAYRLVITFNR